MAASMKHLVSLATSKFILIFKPKQACHANYHLLGVGITRFPTQISGYEWDWNDKSNGDEWMNHRYSHFFCSFFLAAALSKEGLLLLALSLLLLLQQMKDVWLEQGFTSPKVVQILEKRWHSSHLFPHSTCNLCSASLNEFDWFRAK